MCIVNAEHCVEMDMFSAECCAEMDMFSAHCEC